MDTWSKVAARAVPGRSSGGVLLSRTNSLFRLLLRYLFHPRVAAVAREKKEDPDHCDKSAGGMLETNMHYTLHPTKSEWADYAVQAVFIFYF